MHSRSYEVTNVSENRLCIKMFDGDDVEDAIIHVPGGKSC